MSFQLGEVVPLSVTITDATGQPANAGSVTLTVTLPDGTTDVTADIASTTTGVYDHDYATTQAGRHSVYWEATGANASAFTDAFDVTPVDSVAFVSLADVKAHMNKTDAGDDDELAGFIIAACQMINDRIGQVAPIGVSDEFTLHRPAGRIIPLTRPVLSVTSVQIAGNPVTTIPPEDPDNNVEGWRLEVGGVLRHTRYFPRGTVTVAYRAGMTPVPGNVRLAALELASHLWRSSQLNAQGGRPGLSGQDDLTMRGWSYALPFRVRELLGLDKNMTTDVLVG